MARTKPDCITLLATVIGSLEIILFGGVIFGWHNIVYVYKDQGYFNHLCPTANETGGMKNTSDANWLNGSELGSNFSSADENVTSAMLSCEERYKLMTLTRQSGCKSQDEQFNLIFTLATFITGIMCFPNGFLYDRFGTRKCRILAMVFVLTGLMCLIFATPETGELLYPGFIFLCYGGYLILFTNFQISCLIPSYRSMIIATYCGSYDVASTILLFFKLAYENNGVSPNTCFICMTVVFCIVMTFSTFFLLPKYKLPWPHPPNYKYRPKICSLFSQKQSVNLTYSDISDTQQSVTKEMTIDQFGSVMLVDQEKKSESDVEISPSLQEITEFIDKNTSQVKGNIVIENDMTVTASPSEELVKNDDILKKETQADAKVMKFSKVALSTLFLWDLMWICIHRLRNWSFIGVFNPWMTRLTCGDTALVSHYTSFLSSTQFLGIFTAAMSGYLMDRKIKKNYNNRKLERIHASIASFLLNCTVAMLLSTGMTIPVLQVQYATCLLHTIHRSFLYGPNNAFIANAFPMEHFGKLVGLSLTVSGIFGMLQYPLFLLIQGPLDNDPLVVNVILCVLVFCTYLHPAHIWYYLRQKSKKNNL